MMFYRKNIILLNLSLLFTQIIFCQQITNQDVIAKIRTEKLDDIINIQATAVNNAEVYQSLRYVMYVIKTNPQNGNTSRGQQEGRFTLQPNESKNLSATGVNKNSEDKITVLLFIYDEYNKLLGKDRLVVLNDDGKGIERRTINNKNSNSNNSKIESKEESSSKQNFDGVEINGIVTESTKTKSGRDFYNYFYSSYSLSQIKGKGTIHVLEKLSLGRNTAIDVLIDNTIVHSFFVRPRQDYLKQMSDVTIQNIRRYYQQIDKQNKLITQY